MSSQLTDFGSQLIAVKTENKLLVNAFTSLTKFCTEIHNKNMQETLLMGSLVLSDNWLKAW